MLKTQLRHFSLRCQCDVPGVEEDEVRSFLVVTLIHKTPQANDVKLMHPEQGSDHDRVWDPDEEQSKFYVFLCFNCFSHKNISMLQDNVLIF